MQSPADIRKDYRQRALSEDDASADPFEQFERWWMEVLHASAEEPNAMTLSTVNSDGAPSARIVLLKGLQHGRFDFYSNYKSRKGIELDADPRAALTFFWKELERQVRIEGTVTKLSASESDSYFASRPLKSKLGAWASMQSSRIGSRDELEQNFRAASQKFGEDVPRPEHWGGYGLHPLRIEFWQGRESRLHDRLLYSFENGVWTRRRLAP